MIGSTCFRAAAFVWPSTSTSSSSCLDSNHRSHSQAVPSLTTSVCLCTCTLHEPQWACSEQVCSISRHCRYHHTCVQTDNKLDSAASCSHCSQSLFWCTWKASPVGEPVATLGFVYVLCEQALRASSGFSYCSRTLCTLQGSGLLRGDWAPGSCRCYSRRHVCMR